LECLLQEAGGYSREAKPWNYETDNPYFRLISYREEFQDLGIVSPASNRYGSLQSKIEEVSLEAEIAMEEAGDISVTNSPRPDGGGNTGQSSTGIPPATNGIHPH